MITIGFVSVFIGQFRNFRNCRPCCPTVAAATSGNYDDWPVGGSASDDALKGTACEGLLATVT